MIHLGWDEAWDLTRRILAHMNHTCARSAGEMAVRYFQQMLPSI
jgi:glucan phosphorylase